MKFKYQARTREGEIKTGEIDAVSKEAAIDILQKYNVFITYVKESEEKPLLMREVKMGQHISLKDIMAFSRQLSAMLGSKVPPAEAIHALGQKTTNKAFQEVIYNIASDIREGLSLSKAFSKHPRVFSPFYVGMIQSGEVTGNVPEVLKKITSHLEKNYYFRSKVIGAMIYPAMVTVVFFGVFIFLFLFVIPNITGTLLETGKKIPAVTRVVMDISNFFVVYWWVFLIFLLGFVAFLFFYPRTKEGRQNFDRFLLKLPIFGNFQKNLYMARFAENLSTLISAGTPIAQSLESSAGLIGNTAYRNIIMETRAKVMKGENISSSLEKYPNEISPLFIQMVLVGERTGNLGDSLIQVFKFYQEEIDNFISSISSIIEPLLIIFLAVMVGILFAALIIPIYSIGAGGV
ncbi:MAG: type II secretion system F family protein [Candidatus Paceibacterota bacterium]|jgi:type IV pilus assembly protein PilC